MRYNVGDRVRVSKEFTWAQGATGTIGLPFEGVDDILAGDVPFEGCRRVTRGRKGPVVSYWIIFDEPHFDEDGDGPFPAAELPDCAIEPFAEA